MTLTFDNPSGAIWLAAAAAAVAIGIGAALWRRRAATRFADPVLLPRIAPGLSLTRGVVRASLLGGAAACLAVALMDPRAQEQTEDVTRRGADVMFVVDVSRSMLAEDATPNRLARAKSFISDAIDTLGGDRAGLIDFAGAAAVRTPLTLNYDALKTAVDGLEPKDSRRGGTMLGDAIRLAVDSFTTDDAGHAIVILSDGEDMGSDPIAAAREAADRGVRIITVGIGDPREGARIPVGDGPGRRFLVHDGQEVWSRMDAATLRDIADATDGLFVPAATAQVELGEILTRSLGDLERTEGDPSVARTTAPLFQWPAGLALALLVLESVIPAPVRRARTASGIAAEHAQAAGPSRVRPAPRRRRRSGQPRAAASATSAAAVAIAVLSGASMAARADGPGRATQGMLNATPAVSASPADAPATATPPAPAARATPVLPAAGGASKRQRTVGRGQIDRAAFRDAVSRANTAMQSGQYADAAAAFADAMDADPTNAAAAYNRGVAEYRAGKLDQASTSFAEAAARGDAELAADAMFNQGNATYRSALRALEGGVPDADPAGATGALQPAPPAAAQPDLAAATEAVSQALTHYKDAIAANPADIDSRANAELAHTLLKQLRELQQQQQQQQQGDQDQKEEKEKQDPKEDSQQDQQDGGQCDNPQQGDGQQDSDQKKQGQQGGGDKGSESKSDEANESKDPASKEDPSQGIEREDPKDDTQERKPEDRPADEKDSKDGQQERKPENRPSDTQDDKKQSEGDIKAQSGAETKPEQQPPAPAQARAGELVPDAPLSKSEAERLLQGVRDRAKQRMEAKERAERVRQIPAVRDW